MNFQLKKLYESKWNILLNAAMDIEADSASPLLIKVDEKYEHADLRIMIMGQETDGWHGKLKSTTHTVDSLMNGYYDYFYQKSKSGRDRGKRAFWNIKNFKYFEEEIKKHFNDKKVAFIWNNISKIGNDGRGRPSKIIKNLERKYFNILKNEVEILKPNIVIFTTGSSRDSYIKHHFTKNVKFIPKLQLKDGSFADETLNLIAEVELPGFNSISAVRIEHPNRRTLNNKITLNVIKKIVQNKT